MSAVFEGVAFCEVWVWNIQAKVWPKVVVWCGTWEGPWAVMPAFGQNRIWPKNPNLPICFRDHIWPNRIWPELVFQNVDRIWPNRIWPILVFLMFWPNFLCCCCCCSWLVLVVPGCCCLLLFVGACWCLLVPVAACWWCLLVVVVCVCMWWVCSRFLGLSPRPPSAGPPFPWTAQNFALFFFSPAGNFFLSSLSGRSSR